MFFVDHGHSLPLSDSFRILASWRQAQQLGNPVVKLPRKKYIDLSVPIREVIYGAALAAIPGRYFLGYGWIWTVGFEKMTMKTPDRAGLAFVLSFHYSLPYACVLFEGRV